MTTHPSAATLYTYLAPLQIGDAVPTEVYILDYADGQQPAWIVTQCEDLSANGVKLTIQDQDNRDLFNCVQLTILAFPAKVLRTGPYLSGSPMPGRLCDLTQQGRYVAKQRGII